MNLCAFILWIVALALIPDSKARPIARPASFARVLALACLDDADPMDCAEKLDLLAARESGYRPNVAGDCPGMRAGDPNCTRERGAHSCGAWQVRCERVPLNASPLDQAKIARKTLEQARQACPLHPLWAYASGACIKSDIAAEYERIEARQTALASQSPPDDESCSFTNGK